MEADIQVLRDNSSQPKILYSGKIAFRTEGKKHAFQTTKTVHFMTSLKEFLKNVARGKQSQIVR